MRLQVLVFAVRLFRHSHRLLVWYIGRMIRDNESVRLTLDPCMIGRPAVRM